MPLSIDIDYIKPYLFPLVLFAALAIRYASSSPKREQKIFNQYIEF